MSKFSSKIALGTVNFGMDYGIANQIGKTSQTELEKIISQAEDYGIEVIDTAQAYGDAEVRIGSMRCAERFKVITKFGIEIEKTYKPNTVIELVNKSCERLKQSNLYSVMLHSPEVLLTDFGKSIFEELQDLKTKKIITKIGVSIYNPSILDDILKIIEIDLVQAPFNIFDQRILSSGWVKKLKENKIKIYTRSVFLQGILMMPKEKLPRYFWKYWPDLFNSWFEYLKGNGNDPLSITLGFALREPWIEKVVVGVDSSLQLETIMQVEKSDIINNFPNLKCDDENLINPSKWKLN